MPVPDLQLIANRDNATTLPARARQKADFADRNNVDHPEVTLPSPPRRESPYDPGEEGLVLSNIQIDQRITREQHSQERRSRLT